ncbi:MAG: aminoacyl-tRNA hydrolase [Myxococcota bacterium]
MSRLRRFLDRVLGRSSESPASVVPEPTRIIVGLGNPGAEYVSTRHNIGFRVLEALAERSDAAWSSDDALIARIASVEIAGQTCLLMQPQTFMNRSGASLMAALARWPLSPATEVLVVFDDLDLPPGRIRLRPKGGGGGHNGIGDILAELDSKAVPRLRFGVGHPGETGPVIEWVLAPFPEAEEAHVLPEAICRAADAVEAFVAKGMDRTMGQFNGIS